MKWVIENLVKEPSYLELSKAAKNLGYEVQDIRGDYKHADIAHYKDEPVLFFGCIEMNHLVGDQLVKQGCWPGKLANFDNYLCSKFYGPLGQFLFNDDYVMVPLAELKRRPYFFYEKWGKEAVIFVRPDSGEKTFKAGLVDLQDLDSFLSQTEDYKNDLVVIAGPKNITGEWRFMCNDKKEIIAVSSYRYQGLLTKVPSAPPKAFDLVKKVLDLEYFPDIVFCIDVAQDHDGSFWLLELTSCSSAGLYAMSMERVVEGITRRVNEITIN